MDKKLKFCALIAVRMKSKRLPKKSLVDIERHRVIEEIPKKKSVPSLELMKTLVR